MTYKLTISSWNANGLLTKTGELISFMHTHGVDIMLINETKLTDRDKLKIRPYTIYRKDRPTDTVPAGGVAMLVHNKIPHTQIEIPNHLTLEAICIKLLDNTHLIATYNRPANIFKLNEIHTLMTTGNKVLVVGDLNANHTDWDCNRINRNGVTLNTYMQAYNTILQHTDKPTHYPANGFTPSTIDIILNKNVAHITQPESLPELSSDHNPIIFKLGRQHIEDIDRQITSYKNTNWQEFRKTLDKLITINNQINTEEDIESQIHTLTDNLTKAKQKHTQTVTISQNRDHLPTDIIQLIKYRNVTRKSWQRTRNAQIYEQLKHLNKDVRTQIKIYRNTTWTDRLSALNPQDNTLWKITKQLTKSHKPIPTLRYDDKDILTDQGKVEVLAEMFEKIHNSNTQQNTPTQINITEHVTQFLSTAQHTHNRQYTKLYTTPSELHSLIKSLPNRKAPGPDGIENKILKNLSKKAIVQLNYIINAIIRFQHFPVAWKTAIVIPIHKANKNPKYPISYRPISLLNTLSKLTEKILLSHINNIIRKHNLITDIQFGFRPKHNTTQQVVRIVNDVSRNFNKHNITILILLDIEKAFDTVWIEGLIYKLITYNFPYTIIKLIHSYLTDRHLTVRNNNRLSTPRRILAGVPQGSVLGPVLFNLFINDIPTFPKTSTALYADDTAIYAHSFNAQVATKQTQIHIHMIEDYLKQWKIKLNHDKTETITFSKKYTNTLIHTQLQLNKQKIKPQHTVKYLGVHLDSRLTHRTHIKHAIRKAYAVTKSIYSILSKNSILSQKNKKLLYTAIIRPTLTYAAPVWCGASNTTKQPLQKFQNKMLRLITNSDRYARITTLHEKADVPYINDYIKEISQKFYTTQLNSSELTKNITDIRSHNAPKNHTHKVPYQTLPIYHEQLPD